MLTEREVISTLDMLRSEHLDVRTVTLGLNLFDCASDNFDTFAYRVRSKINRHAKNLVAICNEVGDRYGIPVVNKRITVSPIGTVCAGYSRDQMVKVCKLLDDCATDAGVDFLGGFGALVEKGITPGERNLIDAFALPSTSAALAPVSIWMLSNLWAIECSMLLPLPQTATVSAAANWLSSAIFRKTYPSWPAAILASAKLMR